MNSSFDYYKDLLEQTLGIPFTSDNSIEVLKNGDMIFPAMLKAIDQSKERIEFLTFVYWTGNIAHKFANALANKAEEGLEVNVILDSVGAAKMPEELLELMKKSGVQVEHFRPLKNWKFWKMDNRTHRKVLICDGEIAFTGGVGIAGEWEGDARNKDEWRDTHFLIKGPAVFGLHAAFLENWIEAGRPLKLDYTIQGEADTDQNVAVQVIRTSASVRWSDIVMLYQVLIKMAQESIRITTAYFNPNPIILDLLKEAADRGVKIQIMVPGETTDEEIAKVAGDKSFDTLLDAGIDLYYYQKTMLHAKIITIDGCLSCIGSANFNHRSMLKDDEINVVILDEQVTGELVDHFEEDLEQCEKIEMGRWKERGLMKRATEKVTHLFDQQI
ncbi:phosphatidylserine/phosphatidylglycerophosphate/cardiolipin synthase family protein [Rhodohalobacter sp. SW132]|uniref:phospholipase D-like domain-containing protein n=1 Tax=Rhodohalobacter sp. SW132 TaxID=2293433 RepID=UPI001F2A072F|nr:phospholipase D-like domain-containing protein [Rhodohalobacter sp. SW132]